MLKNSKIAVSNIFAIGPKFRKPPLNLLAPTHRRFLPHVGEECERLHKCINAFQDPPNFNIAYASDHARSFADVPFTTIRPQDH
jgi:hypothetical protein